MSADLTSDVAGRSPRLSIVVPIYNVERHLEACLESIVNQKVQDFEAVLVDDGSVDGSADIARRWAAKDSRFRLVQQENHGLGHARNTGARHATGEYLIFLDSDDLVPPDGYRALIESLDASGSDFASGNVHRFNSTGQWQAPMLNGVTRARKVATHVSRSPELLRDHLAPNKMWRTSFWREAEIAFPVGVLYEDVPTTVPAHFRARSVDVVPDVVLLWRVREAGDNSITQSRASDSRHIRDRVAAVTSNRNFFAAQGASDLKTAYDAIALDRDLRFFVDLFEDCDEQHREEMREAIEPFVAGVSAESAAAVKPVHRIKYALLRRGAFEELVEFLRMCRAGLDDSELIDAGWALVEVVDRRDPRLASTADAFNITNDAGVVSRVSAITLSRKKIELAGWAFLDQVTDGQPADDIEVWLEGNGLKIPARVTRRPDVRANEPARGHMGDRADSGFTAEIPLRWLRRLRRIRFVHLLRPRTFAVMVAVTHGSVRKVARLNKPLTGAAERPQVRRLARDWWLRLGWEPEGLSVRVRKENSTISRAEATDGGIRLTLTLGSACGPRPILELRPAAGGGAPRTYAVERGSGGRGHVVINGAALLAGVNGAAADKELVWATHLRTAEGAGAQRVLTDEDFNDASLQVGDREVSLRQTRVATLNVILGSRTPVADAVLGADLGGA